MTVTVPMPTFTKLEPPLIDRAAPELLPVLAMVMLPVDGGPPLLGEICTCSTNVPPVLLPLAGVKLVTLVAFQLPFWMAAAPPDDRDLKRV